MEGGRGVHHPPPVVPAARLQESLRNRVAVAGPEGLPLERQEPVALEVAEGAVVGEDVEAVGGSLEGASWLVAAVPPLAHVGPEDGGPLVGSEPPVSVYPLGSFESSVTVPVATMLWSV